MALKYARAIVVGPKFPLQHLTLHKKPVPMVFYGVLKKICIEGGNWLYFKVVRS